LLHAAAATPTTETAKERLMREQNRKQKEIPQANERPLIWAKRQKTKKHLPFIS
jgi:hypothetical protein